MPLLRHGAEITIGEFTENYLRVTSSLGPCLENRPSVSSPCVVFQLVRAVVLETNDAWIRVAGRWIRKDWSADPGMQLC